MKYFILVLLLVVGFGIFQTSSPKDAEAPVEKKGEIVVDESLPVPKVMPIYVNASADDIVVDTPIPGSMTGTLIKVSGKARGTWFFEGSFPVSVRDSEGQSLGLVPAGSTKDWMTEEFIPFTAEIDVSDHEGPAMVVFERDNPSGEVERDASVSIPVFVK
jgi:hypothetical protein